MKRKSMRRKNSPLDVLIDFKKMDLSTFSNKIYSICGDKNKDLRVEMVYILSGKYRPSEKCGFHIIRELLLNTSLETLQKNTLTKKLKRTKI